MADETIIDLTPENRPFLDALMRVVATSWPHRDEDAEETLVQAILELLKLRVENKALREIAEALTPLSVMVDESGATGVESLTYLYSPDGAVDLEALRERARALLGTTEGAAHHE